MITREEIEKTRSTRGLRLFVRRKLEEIRKQKNECHKALQRHGLYKVFTDEIIPLSIFALKVYSNHRITLIIDNQGYDAIIQDTSGNIIDYIEITWPQYGKRKAVDAKKIISEGYGSIDIYSPCEDIDRLCGLILETCQKKSIIDYSGCSLVIVIDFVLPFPEHRRLYKRKLEKVCDLLKSIKFNAKRVFLLIMPYQEVIKIFE